MRVSLHTSLEQLAFLQLSSPRLSAWQVAANPAAPWAGGQHRRVTGGETEAQGGSHNKSPAWPGTGARTRGGDDSALAITE